METGGVWDHVTLGLWGPQSGLVLRTKAGTHPSPRTGSFRAPEVGQGQQRAPGHPRPHALLSWSPASCGCARQLGVPPSPSLLSLRGPGHSGYVEVPKPRPLAAWENGPASKDPRFISAFEIKTLCALANVSGVRYGSGRTKRTLA